MADKVPRVEAAGEGATVRAPGLLYHDVVDGNALGESGFPGADADVYKLPVAQFSEHLSRIREATGGRAVPVFDVIESRARQGDFLLTFDDGGISAATRIRPMLEAYGWSGHFFITTGCIGKPGFVSRADIQALARAGHIIGSHSCTHPPMISRCTRRELEREWSDSVKLLSDITGSDVTTASIPGGFYSREVEDTAAAAGIEVLFTSEPVMGPKRSAGCVLFGRYSMQQKTASSTAAALAAGKWSATLPQFLLWNAKKPLKAAGGRYWLRFRKAVFRRWK